MQYNTAAPHSRAGNDARTLASIELTFTDEKTKQGALLASWVEPIFLSSLVVSADPRTDGPGPLSSALRRAIPGRAALAMASQPSLSWCGGDGGDNAVLEISVAGVTFARSKAQVGFVYSCTPARGFEGVQSLTPSREDKIQCHAPTQLRQQAPSRQAVRCR